MTTRCHCMPLVVDVDSTSDIRNCYPLVVYVMRGSFNRKFKVKYGPSSVAGPSGTVYANDVMCRKVPQNQVDQYEFPFNLTHYWITVESRRLNGPTYVVPFVGGVRTSYLACDQVEFNDQLGQWWVVCREEKLKPYGEPQYWRYLIFSADLMNVVDWQPPSPPLPPPPPPPPPSVAPGPSCAEPGVLEALGEYTLTAPGGSSVGYYRYQAWLSGPIRVRLVNENTHEVLVTVRRVNAFYECCDAAVVALLAWGEQECVTLPHPVPNDTFEAVCISLSLPSGGPLTTEVVAIEAGAC